jgi:hypothetical protein
MLKNAMELLDHSFLELVELLHDHAESTLASAARDILFLPFTVHGRLSLL